MKLIDLIRMNHTQVLVIRSLNLLTVSCLCSSDLLCVKYLVFVNFKYLVKIVDICSKIVIVSYMIEVNGEKKSNCKKHIHMFFLCEFSFMNIKKSQVGQQGKKEIIFNTSVHPLPASKSL